MRLPAYYCPHCERFKRWYQITNGEYNFGNCKHCGTKAIDTKSAIETLIDRECKLRESVNKAAPIIEAGFRENHNETDVIGEIVERLSETIEKRGIRL